MTLLLWLGMFAGMAFLFYEDPMFLVVFVVYFTILFGVIGILLGKTKL